MKKKIIYILFAFLLAGCSKEIDLPKLKAKNITSEYGEKIDLEFEDLVDLSDFSDEEIKELEKNGEIDTSELVYNNEDYLVPGIYEVEVSYYSDVVKSIIQVISEDGSLFTSTEIENIEITQGDYDFDFSSVITITSNYGLDVTVTYITDEILVDVPGVYTLYAVADDTNGNEMTFSYQVTIVTEEESQEEETTEEDPESTSEETVQQTTTNTTTTPSTNTHTTQTPSASSSNSNNTASTQTPAATTAPASSTDSNSAAGQSESTAEQNEPETPAPETSTEQTDSEAAEE